MSIDVANAGRFITAVLADPVHKLPLPDRAGRLFLAEGETIDPDHPFYAALLKDRSLLPKGASAEEVQPDLMAEPDPVAEPAAPVA